MAPRASQIHAFPGPQGRFVLILCLGAALLVPVSAGASTASVDGGAQALQYVADPGEANLVRVMRTPGGYEIEDLGVVFPGAAAPRCSPAAPYRVDCSPPVSSIFIELGDRADAVNFASDGPATVNGGDGDDRIAGSRGSDTLNGDGGDDAFGAERDGTDGADVMSGGAGGDTADYSARSAPVQIDLDGVADDGEPGERDNVNADVEHVSGGAGADRIVGNAARNRLRRHGPLRQRFGHRLDRRRRPCRPGLRARDAGVRRDRRSARLAGRSPGHGAGADPLRGPGGKALPRPAPHHHEGLAEHPASPRAPRGCRRTPPAPANQCPAGQGKLRRPARAHQPRARAPEPRGSSSARSLRPAPGQDRRDRE